MGRRCNQRAGAGSGLLEAIRVAAGQLPPGGASVDGGPETGETVSAPEASRRGLRAPVGRATVVVAFSGKGGTGTSMVAINLAVLLAQLTSGCAALVDIDLQYGDAAGMLHVEHHPLTIADLAGQGEDIDSTALDGVLASGPADLRVLRAPSSPELAEAILAAPLRAIIRTTARFHEFVVIDTPSHVDERVLEALELADRVLLVTSYNLSAVRGTKATLLMLEALGVDPDRVDVVLNHTARGPITAARTSRRSSAGASSLTSPTTRGSIHPSIPACRSSWRSLAQSWHAGSAGWPRSSPPQPSAPRRMRWPYRSPSPRCTGADSAWAGGKVAP